MQFKLNYLAIAAVVAFAGTASAQDLVVKIGHVAPTSGDGQVIELELHAIPPV